MNLNRRLLPFTGTLLLTAAFMHAAIGAQGNTIGFGVLAERPTLPTSGFAQKGPDAVTAAWQGRGQIAITTTGYQGCPVLPSSVTASEGVTSINLVVVAGDLGCGSTMESYTTLVRLEGWDEYQDLRLEVRDVGI